jgi:hypothetical protein
MKQFFISSVLLVLFSGMVVAQGKIDMQSSDTIETILRKNVGQTVELRLECADKIGGKVEKVTDKLVQISQITGAEYYDGVVDLEDIVAVVVRTKAK